MKRFYLSTALVALCAASAHCQQESLRTHLFDNHYWSNPAAAGASDFHQLRFNGRLQWGGMPGSPNTGMFSYNGAIRRIGLGARFEYDAIGSFKRTQAEVAYAYHIPITAKARLSIGINGKFGNYRLIDKNNLGLVDVQDNAITGGRAAVSTGDVGVGLYFYMGGLFVGASASNLAQSRTRFGTDLESSHARLSRQIEAMAGYRFSFKEGKTSFTPSAYFRMVQGAPAQVDINLRLGLLQDQILFGAMYRTTMDAGIFAGFRFDRKVLLMYSYEFSFSSLQKFTGGTHELTVGVDLQARKEKKNKPDPAPDSNGSGGGRL